MTDLRARASGKLILIGEHAVVYGYPAVALPLPQLSLEMTASVGNTLWQTDSPLTPEGRHKMDAAFDMCLDLFASESKEAVGRLKRNPPLFKIRSSLPLGAGLGGSAAFSVALIRLCAKILDVEMALETMRRYAHHLESIFHHTPSGIDTNAVLAQSPIFLQKGRPLRELPSLPPCWIVLIHTPECTGTSTMIEKLRSLLRMDDKNHRHLEELGTLARNAAKALKNQNLGCIGSNLTLAHDHLRALELSTPALDRAVKALCDNGALGAKLTGGGGGGIAFGLFADAPDASLFTEFGRALVLDFPEQSSIESQRF
jgi:mevalonate kinase